MIHARWARVGIIGYGAITREVMSTLAHTGGRDAVCGILVRPSQLAEARRHAPDVVFVDSVDGLLSTKPDVVAECAGHQAVTAYADAILGGGDLIVASVGALVSAPPRARRKGMGRIYIPSGAVAGIDGLLAARTAGLTRVTYTSAKEPRAWIGTPAGKAAEEATSRLVFFEGTAREAAMAFPKNANVAATVALAGLGLDATRVRLVSDPSTTGPLGVIDAAGAFGTFRFEILAYASPDNPKTSLLTAHSMIAAWRLGMCFPLAD